MTTRTKSSLVDSAGWIQEERDQANDFVRQEVEEFGFSVRNELEWLNEHMSDIFTRTQTNFADMFRTPGKLRGKTPRTARKVNPLQARQPLTDIFAPNAQPAPASAAKTAFYDKIAPFQIAEDVENRIPQPQPKPVNRATSPNRAAKAYVDSGYHGMMTEDEMELDGLTQPESMAPSSQVAEPIQIPVRDDQPPAQRTRDGKADDTGASDDSFVSAKEPENAGILIADAIMEDVETENVQPEVVEEEEIVQDENVGPIVEEIAEPAPADEAIEPLEAEPENDMDVDIENGTPESDRSSPEKPLARKSSFTFSSLPAREPLGAKKSMGPFDRARSSVLGKSIGKPADVEHDGDDTVQDKPYEARAHSKTSTQLLHERLNMLGKTKEPRPSKSIPNLSQNTAQPLYPQLPTAEPADSQATDVFDQQALADRLAVAPAEDGDDDDWIAPKKSMQSLKAKASEATIQQVDINTASPARSNMHQKSLSTMSIMSPGKAYATNETRHQKAISVSHPNLTEAMDSTTPAGSPMGKSQKEGHLSASKNRLWSALKSAKSIFASSATASAAAKLEVHNSPAPARSSKREDGEHKVLNMPGALFGQKDVLESPARNKSVTSFSPSRKTRSSTDSEKRKEKEFKAQQKAADQLEKDRHKEAQKAAKHQAEDQAKADKAEKAENARLEKERKQAAKHAEKQAAQQSERPGTAGTETASEPELLPPPPPKSNMLPAGKLRAPGRFARPAKPAPVSIKIASQSQRMGSTALGKSMYENTAASAAKPPPRSSSALGHRPGSAQPTNSRVRALEAAQRKKEADERAAAEKAEKKRELERKRAEKAENEKRAEEERKAAEQQRVQEVKLAAQRKVAEKQAMEARKREQDRQEQQRREQERLEQQQREQEQTEHQRREQEHLREKETARKAREAHELAEAIRKERAQQAQAQAHTRGDVPGTLRQLTKNAVPLPNPAKPPKRMLPLDDDDPALEAQRPGMIRAPPSYQQTDAKRRRTNEEQEEQQGERRSVMAPPKRPSTMRKETLPKFSGYTHAPPPAAHHSNMFKATVNAQHHNAHKPTHPSQLVQMSNARIPFAENSNPPATYQSSKSSMHPGYENAPPNKFKTPSRPAQAPKSAKSTPHYPQGDNIELPDIATDSEDESDEDDAGGVGGGFRAPSWVASPALRDLLTQQQLVDPETVFGPIGELKMDEVFKNSKNQERLKRFRDRGSSALWTETGDAVTSAEKRRDMEMRERVVRDGGWRYEPGA